MNAVLETRTLPPMLTQYLGFKREHPDCLLFFQVGDFYELFFQDAVTVSRTLNLTLTSRDKNSPDPIPMCGVPIAVVEGYLERLVTAGFSVALVTQRQEEGPGGKVAITRHLERIVTPGIRLLTTAGDEGGDSTVAAVAPDSAGEAAIAWTDVQSGQITVREGLGLAALPGETARLAATELIMPAALDGRKIDRRLGWVRDIEQHAAGGAQIRFRAESASGGRALTGIPGYAALSPAGQRAVRLLVNYVDEVTVSTNLSVVEIRVAHEERTVAIDAMTRRNLELVRNTRDGGSEGTLYAYLNHTATAGGARLLRRWVLRPSSDPGEIQGRLASVRLLKAAGEIRQGVRDLLRFMPDPERLAARIELDVAGPRELGALRDGLVKLPLLRERVGALVREEEVALLARLEDQLKVSEDEVALLVSALADELPPVLADGGVIRPGYNEELDRLRQLRSNGAAVILDLERRERERTGITSLKVRYNNIIGYFIEITRANVERVPPEYIRRQQTAGGERFTTPELRALESEVLGAEARLVALEHRLFVELRRKLLPFVHELRLVADALAHLDVLAALAELAEREDLGEPVVTTGEELLIEGGRHPVLAAALQQRFIPNSLTFPGGGIRCAIVTGPNMGGKSTFLRQAALIVIMAQIGSFVPARSARIGLVDQIFARIGASDNPAEGDSTFMVEMREIASIVARASRRSLLLVDEVGRGTATADGLSLAQAILEWIVIKLECRTLFATHFHELTELAEVYPMVENLSVTSIDDGGEVVFTHEIRRGAASRSYGLEVARLAGLPAPLLARAKAVLGQLTAAAKPEGAARRQLGLFEPSAPPVAPVEPPDYRVLQAIGREVEALSVNELTPLQALNLLSSLQERLSRLAIR